MMYRKFLSFKHVPHLIFNLPIQRILGVISNPYSGLSDWEKLFGVLVSEVSPQSRYLGQERAFNKSSFTV
jgi:hypothetical protein